MTEKSSQPSVPALDILWMAELADRLEASLPLSDDEIERQTQELAARIEDLLTRAGEHPDEMAGRYSLKRLADLAIAILEAARQRWTESPIPVRMTAEMRATLIEEMTPGEIHILYSLVGLRGPKLAWVLGHFVQTSPDGTVEAVEVDDLTWVQDGEPYRENRMYYPNGHFENEAGQRPTWINAHYELDWR